MAEEKDSDEADDKQESERKGGKLIGAIVYATEQRATLTNKTKVSGAAACGRNESHYDEGKHKSERKDGQWNGKIANVTEHNATMRHKINGFEAATLWKKLHLANSKAMKIRHAVEAAVCRNKQI